METFKDFAFEETHRHVPAEQAPSAHFTHDLF